MCGNGLRTSLLASALLLLCSVASFSQVYHGPVVDPPWYVLHENQLNRIDEIFEMQKALANEQQAQLSEAATQLNEARRQLTTALQQSSEAESLLVTSRTALQRAETSSLQLGEAITSLTRQRNLVLGSSGLLAALALWLAVR